MGNFFPLSFVAYLVSNFLITGLVFYAFRNPWRARFGFALMFAVAAAFNTYLALVNPEAYLNFSGLAWGSYQEFILGAFVPIVRAMVLGIASGQLFLAFGFLSRGRILKVACIGSIVFFAAITPLGFGSAFPLPLIAILGILFVWKAAKAERRGIRQIPLI